MRRACEAWNRTRSVAVVAPDGATAADGDQGGEAEIRTRFLGILDRESGIMGRASYESSQAEESWAWARRERSPHVTPGSLKTRSRGPCLVWSRHLPQNLYGPLGRKPLHHTVAMQRVSQLALRRLLSPPSAAAAARRAAPVTAEAVSGGGSILLPRVGGAGVRPRPSLRFSGSGFHPSASNSCLSSHDSC